MNIALPGVGSDLTEGEFELGAAREGEALLREVLFELHRLLKRENEARDRELHEERMAEILRRKGYSIPYRRGRRR